MRKKLIAVSVVLAIGGGIAAEALAQANPNQLIANRKGAMNLQGNWFNTLRYSTLRCTIFAS